MALNFLPSRHSLRPGLAATLMLTVLACMQVGSAAAQQSGTMAAPMPSAMPAPMALDRNKILAAPGVFGDFSVYKLRPEYGMLPLADRKAAAAEVLAVIDRHKDKVVVDAYLTRGFDAKSDYFLRVHAYDLVEAQKFLVDFRATRFGSYSDVTENLVGITKALNYITKDKSSALNTALSATTYSDPPPRYALMIPVKKNAAWWNLSEADRMKAIEGHTVGSVDYLKNVRRKLYHSTGLADTDWITYFETNDLEAFNNMSIALMSIPENLYHVRWGSPIVLGTIQPVESVVNTLSIMGGTGM